MSTRKFIVAPAIAGSVTIGSRGDNERVLLGRLAETGANRDVFISADQEFVALVVGKRGSGKSYTLGNILEGFATTGATTPISDHHRRRGVLLLDPMGNFWTMMQPVDPHGDTMRDSLCAAPIHVSKKRCSLTISRCLNEVV